jgi:fatty-acyl-CoA synthase
MIPIEVFDPLEVLKAIHQERCTVVYGVPTMFLAELEHPDFDRFDLRSLRTGIMAGAPCPIELMKKVVHKMGVREMTVAYGQTEASPVITQTCVDDPVEIRVSSVGKALPGVEVKIVDPGTGKELPRGSQGELWGRGHNVMKGYYKAAQATADTIDGDGWLHTGDLGTMDEAGYCNITGRLKDMIIRGGENIYPREIEELLYSHPKVMEAQVIGIPSAKYGEEVMAWVRLKDDQGASEEEIKAFCEARIARFKVPRYIKFVKDFPMTVTGKIQKVIMRELSIKELHLEREAAIKTL